MRYPLSAHFKWYHNFSYWQAAFTFLSSSPGNLLWIRTTWPDQLSQEDNFTVCQGCTVQPDQSIPIKVMHSLTMPSSDGLVAKT